MARSNQRLIIAYALGVSLLGVSAQLSLYLPGFDDQPLSVNELGAGTDGRTTWEVVQGVQTDDIVDSFPATATLIEGPNDAVIVYIVESLTASESCAISSGLATCVGVADSLTATITETPSPFLVQGGATTTPAPSPGSSAPSGSTTPSPSQTQSSSSAPAPSSTSNGGMRLKMASSGLLGIFITGLIMSLL